MKIFIALTLAIGFQCLTTLANDINLEEIEKKYKDGIEFSIPPIQVVKMTNFKDFEKYEDKHFKSSQTRGSLVLEEFLKVANKSGTEVNDLLNYVVKKGQIPGNVSKEIDFPLSSENVTVLEISNSQYAKIRSCSDKNLGVDCLFNSNYVEFLVAVNVSEAWKASSGNKAVLFKLMISKNTSETLKEDGIESTKSIEEYGEVMLNINSVVNDSEFEVIENL